jgi:hypothetical protein
VITQVSWRLADTLGYAAFSPDRSWTWEQLLGYIPNAKSSWLGVSEDAAKAELSARLSNAPV